jgi:hypothetical protein
LESCHVVFWKVFKSSIAAWLSLSLSLLDQQEWLLSDGIHVCASTGVGFGNFSCYCRKKKQERVSRYLPSSRGMDSSFVFLQVPDGTGLKMACRFSDIQVSSSAIQFLFCFVDSSRCWALQYVSDLWRQFPYPMGLKKCVKHNLSREGSVLCVNNSASHVW